MPQARVSANVVLKKNPDGPTGTASVNMARLIFAVTDRSLTNTCNDEAIKAIIGGGWKKIQFSLNLT